MTLPVNNQIETVSSSQSNNILSFKSKLELEKLSVKELYTLCSEYGLTKTGNKAKLVEKISNYQEKLPATASSCSEQIIVREANLSQENKSIVANSSQESSKPAVSNPIIPLKLTDVFQLTYRQSDGYINITDLCKAGNKLFADWQRLKRTQDFLGELSMSMGFPIDLLYQSIVSGNNENRGTWSHPQVAINIAQWISPKFDVLVSKWVYEIVLTGKVDVSQSKSSSELLLLQQQLCDAQNLLLTKSKQIEKLSTSLILNKRQHNYHKFKTGPVFYIISDANYTKCKCDIRRFVKVGIEGVDINVRLTHHRTTLPALKIDFLMYTEDCKLIEKNILRKYRKDLRPFLNHEIVFGIDKDKIISNVLSLTKFLNIEYTLEENIEKYNNVIQLLVDSSEYEPRLDSDSDELESQADSENEPESVYEESSDIGESIASSLTTETALYKCVKCLQDKNLTQEFFRVYHGTFLKMCVECEQRKVLIPTTEIKSGMKTKRCNICQGVFSIEDFQKNRTRSDGLECACRNCSCLRRNPFPNKRWTMKKPEMTSEQLYCPRCERVRSKTCFKTSVSRPNGYQSYCTECASEIGKKYPKIKKT